MHLLPRAKTRHIEGLQLELRCRAGIMDVRNLYRAPPAWRALPINSLVKERRVSNLRIRGLEGLIARYQPPQLAVSHLLQCCPPCHHAPHVSTPPMFPVSSEMSRKKIPILAIAQPQEIHRAASEDQLVGRAPSNRNEGANAPLYLRQELSLEKPAIRGQTTLNSSR